MALQRTAPMIHGGKNTEEYAASAPVIDPADITPSELRGKYQFLREIGHGNQGYVYEAIRVSDNQKVAIKQLRIDSVQNWKEYDLFMREAHVLESLNMKGVARFYEALQFLDIPQPCAYIVQEFIDGRSLDDLIHSGFRFSLTRLFNIAADLLTLLDNLHHHEPPVVHRDIKPSNILLKAGEGDEFEVYLIDFGAVANPQIQSGGSTVAGTYGYMPPEQLMGKPQPASDIYALAATLVYAFSGTEPSAIPVQEFRLIIDPYVQMLPAPVVSVLRSMLEPSAEKRNCRYSQLISQFKQFSESRFNVIADGDALISGHSSASQYQIVQVEHFGQRGNLEIWGELSETTPRRVPNEYRTLTERKQDDSSLNADFLKLNAKRAVWLVPGACLFIILGLLLLIGALVTLFSGQRGRLFIRLVFFVGAAGVGLLLIGIKILMSCQHFIRYFTRSKKYQNQRLSVDEDNSSRTLYQKLTTEGRKCIATVVDIQYVPCDERCVESYYQTKCNLLAKTDHIEDNLEVAKFEQFDDKLAGCVHAPASFQIRYKFNPPDDASPNDLIHAIIIHQDPTDTLAVGDSFPILYFIDPLDNAKVMSMPYPFPLKSFMNFKDIIAESHVTK